MNSYHHARFGKRNAISLWAFIAKFACLLALVGVTGCGKGTGKKFALMSPPTGQSLIYHYRLAKWVGDAVTYNVYANEEPFVVVGSGGYFPQIVAPGRMIYKTLPQTHFVGVGLLEVLISNALAKEKPVFKLETKSGEVRFVKWELKMGFIVPGVKVKEVSSEVAMKEMKNLRQFSELTVSQKRRLLENRQK